MPFGEQLTLTIDLDEGGRGKLTTSLSYCLMISVNSLM
jgi:hypothetical protein